MMHQSTDRFTIVVLVVIVVARVSSLVHGLISTAGILLFFGMRLLRRLCFRAAVEIVVFVFVVGRHGLV